MRMRMCSIMTTNVRLGHLQTMWNGWQYIYNW